MAAALPATTQGIRVAGDPERMVRTIAVRAGDDPAVLAAATAAGTDVVVTSDVLSRSVTDANRSPGPAVCDVAHFASEFPWLTCAADLLHRDLGARVAVSVTARSTDPWAWRVGGTTEID
jgi:putative NIF3 family GTP cyclohydrolase 1 type 2